MEQDFQYDTAAQRATVTISPKKQSRSGILERLRYIIQLEKEYLPKASEKLIPMPYYQQVGNSCWAAVTMMIVRAFNNPATPGLHTGKILVDFGAKDYDFGLGFVDFVTTLPQYLADHCQTTVYYLVYFRMQHLK